MIKMRLILNIIILFKVIITLLYNDKEKTTR
jgi:hypothetical protein